MRADDPVMRRLERLSARMIRALLSRILPLDRMDRARCSFANDTDQGD